MLTWNVYVGNISVRKIETHDVFRHSGFVEDCRKAARKFKDDKEGFAEEIRRSLIYYYWSKCEWEIVLTSWPPADKYGDKKIDVCDQVMLNWDKFIDYLWENRKELTKRAAVVH